jgi:hypothetical protein
MTPGQSVAVLWNSNVDSMQSTLLGAVCLSAGLAMALTGCQDGREPSHIAVRDSAGVEIVEYQSPGLSLPRWRLAEPPEVRIGVVEGDPNYQFARVVAGLRLDDGRIVVLDRGARRASAFTPRGEFIWASGREGHGPGEYLDPIALWRPPGDTLAIYDPVLGRVSFLAWSGEWLGSTSVRPIGTLLLPSGVFADGRLLVVHPFADRSMYGMAELWTVSGTSLDSLGRFRQIENMEPGPFGEMPEPLIHQFQYLHAGGEWLFAVRNFGHEVEVRDTTGVLRRLIRWTGRDLTMTAEQAERYRQSLVARVPEQRRQALAQNLEDRIRNRRFPAFAQIFTDRVGRVWLQEWSMPGGDEAGQEWTIADPGGRLEGRIDLPRNYRVLEAGRDYVLAVALDELDVAFVVVHRIEQSDPTQ